MVFLVTILKLSNKGIKSVSYLIQLECFVKHLAGPFEIRSYVRVLLKELIKYFSAQNWMVHFENYLMGMSPL